jgi:hemerythrin-like domain-containing protein
MEIIDRKTGKRVGKSDKENNKKLAKSDPIHRSAEKDEEIEEHSPMQPPSVDEAPGKLAEVAYEDMPAVLQMLIDDHKEVITETDKFEKALIEFKEQDYELTREMSNAFTAFFTFFDDHILPHNRKEERYLFPLLHQKLVADGEHSPETGVSGVDLMEDDHVKFIQLATLSFNFLGLAARLPELKSRGLTADVAWNNAKELVEMIRLHIYREENTLFPIANRLISEEEFGKINSSLTAAYA